MHGDSTPDVTQAMPLTPRQDTMPTIPTTPVPMTPYLCHCEYGTTGRGMGGVNSHYCHHILAIIVPPLQDGAQGLGSDGHDPNRTRRRRQQGQPRRGHCHKDMATDFYSADTVAPLHIKSRKPNLHM